MLDKLNERRHRTYPRVVKRARHNSYRVKRTSDTGTTRRATDRLPTPSRLNLVALPPDGACSTASGSKVRWFDRSTAPPSCLSIEHQGAVAVLHRCSVARQVTGLG